MPDATENELDPDIVTRDRAEAGEFHHDAQILRGEANHLRTDARQDQRMGLPKEADALSHQAEQIDGKASDFDHRAKLLERAAESRTAGSDELKIAHEAEARAAAATAEAARTAAAINEVGESDAAQRLELESAHGKAVGEAATLTAYGQHEHDMVNLMLENATSEETRAHAGLTGREGEFIPHDTPAEPAPEPSLGNDLPPDQPAF